MREEEELIPICCFVIFDLLFNLINDKVMAIKFIYSVEWVIFLQNKLMVFMDKINYKINKYKLPYLYFS